MRVDSTPSGHIYVGQRSMDIQMWMEISYENL